MLRAGRRDVVLSRCHTGIFTGGDACSGVTWSVNLRSMVDIRDDGKPLSEGMCPEEGSRPSEASTPGWHVIEWVDLVPVALVLGVLLVVMIPRFAARRVCLGDSGDLQCASAVLGIAHPPGYGGYVSLGFLATCLPGVDHARAVTLMCAAAGVLAITLLVLLQIRLGVSPWLASAIGLALTVYPRVWANLTAAEVYAPTLALLAASAYLVTKYSFRGCLRNLLLAGICLGFAAGNRPPVAFDVGGILCGVSAGSKALVRHAPARFGETSGWLWLPCWCRCSIRLRTFWCATSPTLQSTTSNNTTWRPRSCLRRMAVSRRGSSGRSGRPPAANTASISAADRRMCGRGCATSATRYSRMHGAAWPLL